MHIGYARVSTHEQNLELQQDALKRAGCKKIIVDWIDETVAERTGLAQMKKLLRNGDTLVVWRFDRLGRSVKDLIAWVNWLEQRGIGFQSLQEAIDTTSTTSGRLTCHIFATLAEFERQVIQEKTQADLKAARTQGRLGGRPKALSAAKQKRAVQLYHKRKLTVKEICKEMGISKPTLYAYVRKI